MEQEKPKKKSPRIIPRPMQVKAAKAMIENLSLDNPKTSGEVMEMIGYSNGVVRTPSIVTESAGYKQALRNLGLTEELITSSLVSDIKEKPKNRLGEMRLGAEILGMNKPENEPEKPKSSNTYNFFFSKEIQKEVRVMEDKIKGMLKQKPNAR